MNCNIDLHKIPRKAGDIVCPICDRNLDDIDDTDRLAVNYLCCDHQDIINNESMIVCRSCGIIQGYEAAKEYIDFYDNRHRIRKKSVYHRKYHLNNIMMDISTKHNITCSVEQKNKIQKIFHEIGKILPQINSKRKRMISIYFILRQVLEMMGLPYNEIPISKSRKTLMLYQQYWNRIRSLIGGQIEGIV